MKSSNTDWAVHHPSLVELTSLPMEYVSTVECLAAALSLFACTVVVVESL